jgi:hypothetical protein
MLADSIDLEDPQNPASPFTPARTIGSGSATISEDQRSPMVRKNDRSQTTFSGTVNKWTQLKIAIELLRRIHSHVSSCMDINSPETSLKTFWPPAPSVSELGGLCDPCLD